MQKIYEHKAQSLVMLAFENKWWAVRNLIRRQVVEEWEFLGPLGKKTAGEWAEHHGQAEIVDEINHYYVRKRMEDKLTIYTAQTQYKRSKSKSRTAKQ